MKEMTRDSVFDSALRILEYGDCSAAEMKRKLQKKGVGIGTIDEVIDSLKDSGLINDTLYAENYTRYALERGKGPAWIRNKLMQKGVSSDNIALAAESLDISTSEKSRCLQKALNLCGLSDHVEIQEDGSLRSTESTSEGPTDYFGRKIPPDTDRFEARTLREKEKSRLSRRLAGAGFSQSAVIQAVREIEKL